MRSIASRLGFALCLAGASMPALHADSIQVGTANAVTAEPFGDNQVTAYEQFYASGDFSSLTGPVNISELDFSVDTADLNLGAIPITPGDPTLQPFAGSNQFQVTLSTIDPTSNLDLSSNILDDLGSSPTSNATATLNLTTDPTTGAVTGGVLAVVLQKAFLYDPTQDLLLDVQQPGATPWTVFSLQADTSLDSVGMGADCLSSVCSYGLGLVTTFVETPASSGSPTVPEGYPVALPLTAVGMLVLLSRRRDKCGIPVL